MPHAIFHVSLLDYILMFSLNFIQTIEREIDGRMIIVLIFESKPR